jgi:uncharacterized SAM-binding protein YcdF (DUF218 family)
MNDRSAARYHVAIVPWFGTLLLLALLLMWGGWLTGGKSGSEKLLIRLVQPVGFAWLAYTAWLIQLAIRNSGQNCLKPFALWCIIMLLTTSPFSVWCVKQLESTNRQYDPREHGTLDTLVVLGGGTRQGPLRAELAGDGDRVMYAAQLYFQGHAKHLIATGDATPGVSRDFTSPREQTVEIWQSLKIPAPAISTIEGLNTFEELQNLSAIWPKIGTGRVGLLTSASHLPRAMRLARARGLELIPVPADHDYSDQPFTYLDFIPSAGPLNQLAACQHEWLAWLVHR